MALATPAVAAEEEPPSKGEPPKAAEPLRVEPAPPSEAEREKALKWEIEGYISEELEFENASGEASDSDLDSHTRVLFDATRGENGWHVRLNGLLFADLAGDSAPNDPLRDFWDRFDNAAQGRLYEGWVELPRLADGAVLVRLGRQYLEEEVFLQFDGGRVDVDLGRSVEGLNLSLVAGVPVYFPEDSRNGDWLIGLVARGKLCSRARARISYYHVSQNFEGINDPVIDPIFQAFVVPAGRVDDDLLALSVWVDLAENLYLYTLFDFLEWDPNELQVQVRWHSDDARWSVVAQYDHLFGRLVNVANEISPFVPLLGAYQPFLVVSIRANYRPDDRWVFLGGIAYRALEDDADEGVFNHEYWSFQAGATRLAVLAEKLDVTVTVNGYSSDAGPDVVALAGSLDYRVNTKVSLSGGIDYSYYKYIVQQGSERDNVWTYHVNVEWEIRPRMELDAGISVDVDDLITYVQLMVRLTVRF